MKKFFLLFTLFLFSFSFGQLMKVTSSDVRWKAYKSLKAESLSHYGTIGLKSGAVLFENGQLKAGTFYFDMNVIDAEDMNGDAKGKKYLENHLKSDDFFDTGKYPTAVFKLTSIKPISGNYNYRITGKLTIKNKTKTISFPAKITKKGDGYDFRSAQFTFDRHDFDMNYDTFEDMFISDDVEMNVSFTVK